MTERNLIITEYFKLRVLLNRANKKPDEKTEVTFLIRDLQANEIQFVASLIGEQSSSFIELCIRKSLSFYRWERSGAFGLNNLEDFCASRLQTLQDKLSLQDQRRLSDSQKMELCSSIEKELRSLIFEEHI